MKGGIKVDIIQIILLAIATFIFAIDQYSLTELLYRPIISCTIIGLILGDLRTGLIVGGTYELMVVGNMPIGGAQPPNSVIGGVVAMVFAIKANMGIDAALGAAVIFSVFGQYVVTFTFAMMSAVMAKADKAAEEANPKLITSINLFSMCVLGCLFALLAVLAYVGGVAMAEPLQVFASKYSWVMAGLGVAGGMMRYVGFGILLKIMLGNDMWGIYLAGFACAALFGNLESTSGATLILVVFVGLAIALHDYHNNVKIREISKNNAGGMDDGI